MLQAANCVPFRDTRSELTKRHTPHTYKNSVRGQAALDCETHSSQKTSEQDLLSIPEP